MEEGILDIKYYDMNTWNEYFNQDVLRLYEATVKFLKIYEQVKNLSGKNAVDLIKDEGYKTILLGGVEEDGSFTELSASKFYRDMFGLDFDVNAVISAIKVGENINVPIQFEENELYKKVLNIYSNLDFILNTKGISKPNVSSPPITDYRSVLETLKEFEETSLSFLSIYNPKTFFVTSLRGTTLKAFKLAYPKFNEEIMKLFGLSKILEISYLPDQKKEYTIWGYADMVNVTLNLNDQVMGTSIGSAIMVIDHKISELFGAPLTYYTKLDRDVKDDYRRLFSNIKPLFKGDKDYENFGCLIEKFNVHCSYRYTSKGIYFSNHYGNNLINFLNDIGLLLIYVYQIRHLDIERNDRISIGLACYLDI
ncbi:hypothetical protein [Sulfurisphaera ohwakuensis]|uniref:Uncharacterized protein n=1 Tax=Sulfurisphaera ohwakuensis TaxID=69656 RepID=A0A650CFP6_SULOH|nr:hypothetical protein [Sulfurisphaera ohwakuensis]MBB5254039.1 hypothetical protein [Sulfurisphaera ohwakuensis]QGR16644.1 hypothetical protein D1869_05160 [Sulfurisphaera ohwakuensis]